MEKHNSWKMVFLLILATSLHPLNSESFNDIAQLFVLATLGRDCVANVQQSALETNFHENRGRHLLSGTFQAAANVLSLNF